MTEPDLVSHHCLMSFRVSVTIGLGRIDNPTHFLLLLIGQFNISRCPVVFQALRLSGAGNGNHSLGSNPGESHLTDWTASPRRDLLDLFNNCLVLVKIVALEFRS